MMHWSHNGWRWNCLVFSCFVVCCCLLLTLCANSVFAESSSSLRTDSGELEVLIEDYPDGSHQYQYYLKTAENKRYKLLLQENLKRLIRNRARASISGIMRDDSVEVRSLEIEQSFAVSSRNSALFSGTRSVAVILVNLSDVNVPCSASDVENLMYNNAQSVRGSVEASSRGQLTFNSDTDGDTVADVFGPYSIAYSSTVCNFNAWADAADAAAQADGVNISSYQHRVYVLPQFFELSCGWAGLAHVGCEPNCQSWIADCSTGSTYVHELGHNFGMHHASTDLDNNAVIDSEYGDSSCPMGASSLWTLFNAPHQDQMGWFDAYPNSIGTISSDGTFSLTSLEIDPALATSPQIYKISSPSNGDYYLSYRTSVGIYNEISATYEDRISIHRFDPENIAQSRVVASLAPGESFVEPTLGFTIMPISSEVSASTRSSGPSSITLAASFSAETDSDGDGVSDAFETAFGTDLNDAGSYYSTLSSPVYVLWNGFLDMFNIIELVNPSSSSATSVTIDLFSSNGSLAYTENHTIAAGNQLDIVLNSLPGFANDAYGIAKITFSGSLDGRTSFYRLLSDGVTYDFAYSIPFENAISGDSAVTFNTFQPSANAAEANYAVFNWLSIINLESTSKNFSVFSYDQSGVLLQTANYTVSPFARIDIDGGHGLVGPNVVGLHRIVPSDVTASYKAGLIRYGAEGTASNIINQYSFAFPLSARPGSGAVSYIPISKQFDEDTWLEVANTTASDVSVSVVLYDSAGTELDSSTVTLAPYSQQHILGSQNLASGDSGYAKVDSSVANSLIAQAMYYYKNVDQGIDSMYGLPAKESIGSSLAGSYNLFLEMDNWLRITNTSSSNTDISVTVTSPISSKTGVATMSPNTSLMVNIHDSTIFDAQANTYGLVEVSAAAGKSIITQLVRIKQDTSAMQFGFPTAIRPE